MDLASKGLPNTSGVGFEIFDRSNFGISDFVQRTNYTRALQGELAQTIEQMQGVKKARVMVVLPESRLLVRTTDSRPTDTTMLSRFPRREFLIRQCSHASPVMNS